MKDPGPKNNVEIHEVSGEKEAGEGPANEINGEAMHSQREHKGENQGGTSQSVSNNGHFQQEANEGGSPGVDNCPGGLPRKGGGPGGAEELYAAGIT